MRRIIPLLFVVSALVSRSLPACPSCYGAGASGPMIDGTNTAILFMLGITGMVLCMITLFFVMMRRRTRRLSDRISGTASLNEQGILQWKSI